MMLDAWKSMENCLGNLHEPFMLHFLFIGCEVADISPRCILSSHACYTNVNNFSIMEDNWRLKNELLNY